MLVFKNLLCTVFCVTLFFCFCFLCFFCFYCFFFCFFFFSFFLSSLSQVFLPYLRSWLYLTIFCPSLLPPVSYLFLVLLSFSILQPKMQSLNFEKYPWKGMIFCFAGTAKSCHYSLHRQPLIFLKRRERSKAAFSLLFHWWNYLKVGTRILHVPASCCRSLSLVVHEHYFSEIKPDSSITYTCVSVSPESGP